MLCVWMWNILTGENIIDDSESYVEEYVWMSTKEGQEKTG
jgi:hypothetical protein